MKKNKITVFNDCVDSHPEELDYFENLITKHYQKFTYGYNILQEVDLFDKISKVDCIFEDKKIRFVAKFKKNITKKDAERINDASTVAYNHKKFTADISIDGVNLEFNITKNPKYKDTFE